MAADPIPLSSESASIVWDRIADDAISGRTRNTYLNLQGEEGVRNIRTALESHGQEANEYINVGSFALIVGTKKDKDTVTRVETFANWDTLELPIAQQPVSDYTVNPEGSYSDIRVRTVLRSVRPDSLGLEDVIRTASVLKAQDALETIEYDADKKKYYINLKNNRWTDAKHEALAFLVKPNGGYITYSDGKTPIAFIQDINGTISLKSKTAEDVDSMESAHLWLADEMQKPLKKFLTAIFSQEPSPALTKDWQSVLERLLSQKGEAVAIETPAPLPEGWRQTLKERLAREGGVSEKLAGSIESIFAASTVSKDTEIKVEVPLQQIDALIPKAIQRDVDACNQQMELIEAVKQRQQEGPSREGSTATWASLAQHSATELHR